MAEDGAVGMQFGMWLPVYGGWLRAEGFDGSPSVAECLDLARSAEDGGFSVLYASENFLNCVHGADHEVLDAWTLISALSAVTTRIRLASALKPAFRSPLVAAQMTATADHVSRGRIEINIACGWWRDEFEICAADWRGHDDKYAHAAAYLAQMEGFWSGADRPRRPTFSGARPPVWVGGHSDAALRFAADHCDVLFLNGMPPERLAALIDRFRMLNPDRALPRIAMNAFVISADTDAAAQARRAALLAAARPELIGFYREAMTAAGTRAWSELEDAELIDSNGGFATALVGSAETITDRIRLYEAAGVGLLLCQFPDMAADSTRFSREIINRHSRATNIQSAERGFQNV